MISWVPSLYTKSFSCYMGLETLQAAGLSSENSVLRNSGTRNFVDTRTPLVILLMLMRY